MCVLVTMLVGCGDSGGGTASDSNSGGASETGADTGTPTTGESAGSASGTESAEGGVSESISGTTSDEGGVSESLSQSGGTDPDSISGSGTGDDTGMISGGGDTTQGDESSTGAPPIVCSEIDNQQECLEANCQAITGQQFGGDEAMACLDPTEFLACMDPMGCDDVITTVCAGEEQFYLPNSCKPEGWVECMPPPDQGNNGYPECP